QPSALSHQNSAISTQPSELSHQHSAIRTQPSELSHQNSAEQGYMPRFSVEEVLRPRCVSQIRIVWCLFGVGSRAGEIIAVFMQSPAEVVRIFLWNRHC